MTRALDWATNFYPHFSTIEPTLAREPSLPFSYFLIIQRLISFGVPWDGRRACEPVTSDPKALPVDLAT